MGLLSSPLVWTAAATLAFFFLFSIFKTPRLRRDGAPLRWPPNTLPLMGNGILFLQARHKLFAWFAKCERQFGYETFQIAVPTLPPGVVISDPRNLEFVFKNEGTFSKGAFVKGAMWDLFGHGIINADGDFWKLQRKAGLSFLSTANLRVLTDIAMPEYLSRSIRFLKSKADGSVVDLQAVFHEITSLVMGKMAYNMEMHADDEFTMAFDFASGATAERFQNPLWFVTDVFLGSKFRKSVATVKAFGRRIVAKAVADRRETDRAETAGSSRLDETSGSLIQSLLDAIGDEQMVSDAALNYLSAGRDTTAQALTWTFYLLMKHRYVASKVRREVQAVLDEHGASRESAAFDPTLFTPTSMPYTMGVFYETLRLYPPIPFEIRQCETATTLPDGTLLPKTSIVVWCLWATGRSVTTWGPDADSFRPERWLQDGRLITKGAAEYPVFNGGPRTCLGKKMAEVIAVQAIASMAWMFDFIPADDKERVSKSSLTLPMEGGLPCFVKSRSYAAV